MGAESGSSPSAAHHASNKVDPLHIDSSGGNPRGSPISARLRGNRKALSNATSSSGSSSSGGGSGGSRSDLDTSVVDQLVEDQGLVSIGERNNSHKDVPHHREEHLLGEWSATALCGNDVMSSCLYTVGLVTQSSGKVAPIAFILVSIVLYLIKSVYAMAVLSFPHNGGSYNLLANVAPRPVAALGACLSIISYIATCVVSAVSACDYLEKVIDINPVIASVILLFFFAALVLWGLKESSSIAFAIFCVHMASLFVLSLGCFAYAASERFSILWMNADEPYPRLKLAGTEVAATLGAALFMGFSSAMLGVSGYETTAQCIESMHSGTFVNTLRNLWVAVTLINPLLSFLAISVLPIAEITANSDTVLAKMARVWGDWFFGSGSQMSQLMADWMSIDAFIVLSGAVLTAFVGVDGLIFQMSTDRCLPKIFLKKNRWRGTNHYIILTFLTLCVILIVLMNGRVNQLAGIYSMAFLGVLATFILGSMLLKVSPKHAASLITKGLMVPWWHLILALSLVVISLIGNFLGSSNVILSFFSYFAPIYGICVFCLYADKARLACCPASRFCQAFGSGLVASSPVSPPESPAMMMMETMNSKDINNKKKDNNNSSGKNSPSRQRGSKASPTLLALNRLETASTSSNSSVSSSSSSSPSSSPPRKLSGDVQLDMDR